MPENVFKKLIKFWFIPFHPYCIGNGLYRFRSAKACVDVNVETVRPDMIFNTCPIPYYPLRLPVTNRINLFMQCLKTASLLMMNEQD